jgi:molecular chaperone HtpG
MSEQNNETVQGKKGGISVETAHIFPVIKKWLYSEKDIFLREIVSNAADAVTKHKRLCSLGQAESDGTAYRIDVRLDAAAKTLTVSDNGIGMTEEELLKYLGSIALSGAMEFIQKYEGDQKEGNSTGIIGHFGLGFYSAFMVADDVEVITKSWSGAPAVRWLCHADGSYELFPAERETHGTDIVMHIAPAEEKYLNAQKIRDMLEKYCSFMPTEIYFTDEDAEAARQEKAEQDKEKAEEGKDKPAEEKQPEPEKPINDIHPLWQKAPSECTPDDYKAFYRKVFHDYREPLFWIHINADYPLNFKGILFFPRLDNEYESIEGQVKLYYNQVFVADNIKEVIPEYLLMLKGVLDCPELPLNVSRSYLQNNTYVSKVSAHIVKKVCDKLNSLCNTERENYESVWDSIKTFVEYACMRDRKFYDRCKDAILLTLTDGSHVTLAQYAEKAKADGHAAPAEEGKEPVVTVYYATDRELQAQYISLFEAQGIQIAVLDKLIDTQFVQMLESYDAAMKFQRIDADPAAALKADGDVTENQALADLFRTVSGNEKLEVKFEVLKDASLPSMLTVSEQSRRMEEMMKMYAMQTGGKDQAPLFPLEYTLLLNTASPLISKLADLTAEGAGEDAAAKAKLIAGQIWQLSVLAQRKFTAEELKTFLAGSFDILAKL